MDRKILIGRGHQILEMPEEAWKKELAHIPEHNQARLAFMTEAHQRVRYFAVKELADRQTPLEPGYIAEKLNLPLEICPGDFGRAGKEAVLFGAERAKCGSLGLPGDGRAHTAPFEVPQRGTVIWGLSRGRAGGVLRARAITK